MLIFVHDITSLLILDLSRRAAIATINPSEKMNQTFLQTPSSLPGKQGVSPQ
jgi:hypothetical protein